jgi:hypothetical protein
MPVKDWSKTLITMQYRKQCYAYEGESVNRSQMHIKHKTFDIRTWKKTTYFSTYPPPKSIHLSDRFASASKPAAKKTSDYPLNWVRLSTKKKKKHNKTLLFSSTPPQAWLPFWLLKPACEHALARLLPRLSCSWTVLLHVDYIENLLHPLQLLSSFCDLFTDSSLYVYENTAVESLSPCLGGVIWTGQLVMLG